MNSAPTVSRASSPSSSPVPLSIRILRRMRPLVVALLESPLHRLLSRDLLLLHYRGRRSGQAYTLPLSYVARGDALYLCTRPEGSRWWRNLDQEKAGDGVDVELQFRGRRLGATAKVLDRRSEEALDGLRTFLTRNPGTGTLLYHVSRGAGGPVEEDLRREVLHSVVVRVDPR